MLKIIMLSLILLLLMIVFLRLFNMVLPQRWRLALAERIFMKHAVVAVLSGDGQVNYHFSKAMDQDSLFYAASVSKLYTHALIYQLVDSGILDLNQPFRFYLPEDIFQNLLIVDGKDYTDQITLQDLLDQTSGFNDYETDRFLDGSILLDQVKEKDIPITELQALELTRQLKSGNQPGQKAHYSNINAIILGEVAVRVTGITLTELYQRNICEPLNLDNTHVINDNSSVQSVYLGKNKKDIRKYAGSAPAAGGLITNNQDLMRFIRAFFQGQLFDSNHLKYPIFRRLQFFPIKYGQGMMSCQMSEWMSPIIGAPLIMGHSGITGSFAFYCLSKDLFITGTTNRVEKPPFNIIYLFLNGL